MNFIPFLIICPLTFLAGLVDSIAGGGGLISLPAFLLAGLPPHNWPQINFLLPLARLHPLCATANMDISTG